MEDKNEQKFDLIVDLYPKTQQKRTMINSRNLFKYVHDLDFQKMEIILAVGKKNLPRTGFEPVT